MSELTPEQRETLHDDMAAWAYEMPYNRHPQFGLSNGIWTVLDAAVERILADLRESIAADIEAERTVAFSVGDGSGWSHAITRAARIARGCAR